MSFTPIGPPDSGNGFIRQGGSVSGYPENGTTYLQASLGDSLAFSFDNSTVFDLISVDLAEYSIVVNDPATVQFIGYRHDGTIVTESFTTDGIIDGTGPLVDFQTFTFDNRFTGLDRVQIPNSLWSLDNLIVSIPEPGSAVLLLAGFLLLAAKRPRRHLVRSRS